MVAKMNLIKIISGGQTGADQAALDAALKLNIETGGWCPRGCLTEDGPNYDLIKVYKLKETSSDKYPQRTYFNVRDSDGTIRVANDLQSPGQKLTLKAINFYNKPYIDIKLNEDVEISKWLKDNDIRTLNVAGNRESKCPGIYKYVFDLLYLTLK